VVGRLGQVVRVGPSSVKILAVDPRRISVEVDGRRETLAPPGVQGSR